MSAKAARDDRLFGGCSRARLAPSINSIARKAIDRQLDHHRTIIRVFRYLRQESPREPESVGRELERVEWRRSRFSLRLAILEYRDLLTDA